ncbi:hypothetical protein OS493_040476 [Desmophyllum pertusum]|uniref:Uncharacterized protein n=1 Tax=Desmophyllum pertusum TaxID=174260 RepID=A0A9X0CU09_9CNID|nr:hypothetical protein OS493_040476 [Desmophyllum pertusum]
MMTKNNPKVQRKEEESPAYAGGLVLDPPKKAFLRQETTICCWISTVCTRQSFRNIISAVHYDQQNKLPGNLQRTSRRGGCGGVTWIQTWQPGIPTQLQIRKLVERRKQVFCHV